MMYMKHQQATKRTFAKYSEIKTMLLMAYERKTLSISKQRKCTCAEYDFAVEQKECCQNHMNMKN